MLFRSQTPKGRTAFAFDAVTTVETAVRAPDGVYLVEASTIVGESAALPGSYPAPIVLSAKKIDAAYLTSLKDDLGVAKPGFGAVADKSRPGVPIRDVSGRVLGWMQWMPERPGLHLLERAAPFVALLLLALTWAGMLMARRVREILFDLAENERRLRRKFDVYWGRRGASNGRGRK